MERDVLIYIIVLWVVLAGLWVWVQVLNTRLQKANKELRQNAALRVLDWIKSVSFWDNPSGKWCLCIPEDKWEQFAHWETVASKAEVKNEKG